MSTVTSEKYILAAKELHLGYIKETFHAGAVIELDTVRGKLVIDGRKFDDVRDLDILRRQSAKHPEKPFIVPFSEEALQSIKDGVKPSQVARKPKPGENMPVIQSDEDGHAEIDISSTQVSKRKAEAKEAQRTASKERKLEVIRGDESVEERLASLKGKNDPASIAERTRLKSSGVKMQVVQDDSLGMGTSSKTVSMNAGQVLPSREAIEARAEDAKALADARKREAEMRRKASSTDEEELAASIDSELTARPVSPKPQPEVDSPVATVVVEKKSGGTEAIIAENTELKARLERMEKMMEALTAKA